jgi:DNA polymerase III epsilon subunit-like protein
MTTSQLQKLRKRFKSTLKRVAKILGVHPSTIKRDEYVRMTVDLNMRGKLNKEDLNACGGYKELKKTCFNKPVQVQTLPKVLIFDIETAPMEVYTWGIWNVNIGLNQIIKDWSVISWSAKWLGDAPDKVMYEDNRKQRNVRDDRKLLKSIHKLLDQADIVVTQNGISFDSKKLNARFIINGMKPPSSYKHIDTKRIAKRHFGFTSNKLEYMTDHLCTDYKKLKHGKFPGFSLWKECLAGNLEAWKEMEEYNRYDVLSLEELYTKMQPWDNTVDFNIYTDDNAEYICNCGHGEFREHENDYYTPSGRFTRYICTACGNETRGAKNKLSKAKKKKLRRKAVR